MEWLESKGASGAPPAPPVAQNTGQPEQVQAPVQTDVQTQQAPPEAPVAPQTPPPAPVEQPAASAPQPQEPVTPTAPPADDSKAEAEAARDAAAVQNVEQVLGGVEMVQPDTKCEQCGNQVDDTDLAQLGKSRFGRFLCVADYIAETKKPSQG